MDKRIQIGNTELSIFPVVLGSVGAGKDFSQENCNALIDKYLDLGGNVLDSARMYANGQSEAAIGEWLRSSGRRNDIVLITKGGHPRVETMHTSRMAEADMRADIEESLRSLGTDCIDLYFYHRDAAEQPVEESVAIMEKFVKEGKIRYYGCSNWKAERIRAALDYSAAEGLRGFAANQMLFNIACGYMKPFADDTMVTIDDDMKRLHAEHSILSMPYFGVCSGFFYILKAKGEDAVKNSPYYTPENVELAKKIYRLAEEKQVSITAILLSFYFVQDFPNAPLYGPTNPAQLDDIASLLDAPLARSDYEDALGLSLFEK